MIPTYDLHTAPVYGGFDTKSFWYKLFQYKSQFDTHLKLICYKLKSIWYKLIRFWFSWKFTCKVSVTNWNYFR